MTNERLRAAITDAGMSLHQFGEKVGVDPKTVERWISTDRIPHRTHRINAAHILGKTDVFLWPATDSDPRTRSATRAEFVDLYPSRAALPVSTWEAFIDNAREAIDLLAFAGSFLHDSIPEFAERIASRAENGVRVRLLFGDPQSAAVALRGEEEGIGELMAARCNLTWNYLTPLLEGVAGIEARKHGSTLYASLFRFDDQLLVNPHALGAPAGHSPMMHVNRIPGGRLFAHYMESFERTWRAATPA
ncbi:XRE family transcriptional regulator [Cellulomonas sp.]|uniref:XRE family transcriptional regulator n=1 Tax=Cellulomonas sp. TaxID=40001 RepID=UPI0025BD3DAA|nr:XRE family transcriptional regulator [Cellulomonas sp.]